MLLALFSTVELWQKHFGVRALSQIRDLGRRVTAWRAHPFYHKTCECGHMSIFHNDGQGKCNYRQTDRHGKATTPKCQCRKFKLPSGVPKLQFGAKRNKSDP